MAVSRNRLISTLIFLGIILVMQGNGEAKSSIFRNVNQGDIAPPFELQELDGTTSKVIDSLQGKPMVMIFWGADVETKKIRSTKALKKIQTLSSFFAEQSIGLISVNVQGDSQEVINQVITEAGLSFPTLLDQDRKMYGSLGIFVMPSILLLDKDRKIMAGIGFSHDFIERLLGEIAIMRGEKTREQVKLDLRPKMIEKSPAEKAANRHMNMGRVLIKQGMVERGMQEFQKALKLNPQLAEAHIELACNYIDLQQFEEAEKSIEAGLDLAPDSLRGQICDARLSAALGELDEAINDLQALMMRNARDPSLNYTLGSLYEQKDEPQKAAKSYRKAYELLLKKENLE